MGIGNYFMNSGMVVTKSKGKYWKYYCTYVISPEKMYFLYTSKDINHKDIWITGGPFGLLIMEAADFLLKKIQSRLNRISPNEDKELEDLPVHVRGRLPRYRKSIIISRSAVKCVYYNDGEMKVSLKTGRWFATLIPLLPLSNISKAKELNSYLIKNRWV